MKLVEPLVAGIRGAENGTAYFTIRGTATPLPLYYTDFEAAVSVATGQLALDANGGGVAYVPQMTNVIVKSSAGATIRTFVAGDNDASVEVANAAFTGAAYVGGAIAAGNPTTLKAAMLKWQDSAGAGTTDWKVLYNGVATNLSALAGKIGTPIFNVKAPEYGAVGDGVTDDTAAINLAKTAAVDGGGGIVFFPPGTYAVSSTLDLQDGVSLQGCGASATTISKSNTGTMFTLASDTNRKTIQGLTFKHGLASGSILFQTVNSNTPHVSFYQCIFGSSNDSGIVFNANGSSEVVDIYCEECTIASVLTTSRLIGSKNQASVHSFSRCKFLITAAATNNYILTPNGVIDSCIFDMTGFTSGTIPLLIEAALTTGGGGTGKVAVTNCDFTNTGGGTVTGCLSAGFNGGTPAANSVFVEEGNRFGTNTPYRITAGTRADTARVFFGSRAGGCLQITDNSTPLDLTSQFVRYETIVLTRTTNADQVVTLNTLAMGGCSCFLTVINSSGGTIASETVANGAAVSMTNGSKRMWHYRDDASVAAGAGRGILVNGATVT